MQKLKYLNNYYSVLNLDFALTQNEKFYYFFFIISTFLVNYYNI